jgi:hypothetical protein
MNAQLLQLLISLFEVAAMAGLCALLFGWNRAAVPDLAAAIGRDIAGFRPGRVSVSADAKTALVENARDGQVYLAVLRGDGVVTRRLSPAVHVSREGRRLTLDLRDFTLKRTELDLADAAEWEARLKGAG